MSNWIESSVIDLIKAATVEDCGKHDINRQVTIRVAVVRKVRNHIN